ncbi:uncharacterized protein LOC141907111 isoform X2 [Tubulanus polymorphus]|uniref:uncharacterized protein LOC141907111 isoform X2 n=1 Tax=Tubulanus polymorphus TaxID=672921 RepID=UPI003DA62301
MSSTRNEPDETCFETIALDDKCCDLCGRDTGEKIEPCDICLNPVIAPIKTGYNSLPEVIHHNYIAHHYCFRKAHEVCHTSRHLLSSDGSTTSPTVSPFIIRKRLSESIAEVYSARRLKPTSGRIINVIRDGFLVGGDNQHRRSTSSLLSKQSTKTRHSTDYQPCGTPQQKRRQRSMSDGAFLSASLSNLTSQKDAYSRHEVSYRATSSASDNAKKTNRKVMEYQLLHGGVSTSDLGDFDEDLWQTVKPYEERHLVITVDSSDAVSLQDWKSYSPKSRDDEEDNDESSECLDNQHVKRIDNECIHNETVNQKTLNTTVDLKLLKVDELRLQKNMLDQRVHCISSELVDLLQKNFSLKEEIDIRHVVIRKLVQLEEEGLH